MDYEIGDAVIYTPGHMGYHSATIVGFDGFKVIIEFSSGKQISAWENELDAEARGSCWRAARKIGSTEQTYCLAVWIDLHRSNLSFTKEEV
jgi:hypothetical protein